MPDQEIKNELLYDKKWHLLIKRAGIFKHIPFIDFVFGGGSLAVGNVDAESDFDVLIGVRSGRIFTTRFLSAFFFGVLGWRRAKEHGGKEASDKICLNHFVTQASYKFRLAPNAYWRILYKNFVPVYGEEKKMQEFFAVNKSWVGERNLELNDLRYCGNESSRIKIILEKVLSSSFGDLIERFLKRYQIARIQKGGLKGEGGALVHRIKLSGVGERDRVELPPLIVYNDEELEFHPDKAVIEIE
jgi:hypothetical protein